MCHYVLDIKLELRSTGFLQPNYRVLLIFYASRLLTVPSVEKEVKCSVVE
jgi:hypothetical protein